MSEMVSMSVVTSLGAGHVVPVDNAMRNISRGN